MNRNTIESLMDSADEWSARPVRMDTDDVINQHAASASKPDAEVLEIDEDSAPAPTREASRARAEQQRARQRKKKLLLALAGVIAVTAAAVVVLSPQESAPAVAAPTPHALPQSTQSQEVVQSQFAAPAAQPAQAQLGGQAQQESVPASPAQQSPAEATPAQPAQPQPQPTPSDAEVRALREQLARMEDENRRLKAAAEKAAAEKASAQRSAADQAAADKATQASDAKPVAQAPRPQPLRYGADVYRIYDDGIVLQGPDGQLVSVALGERMRRYGVLRSTDPQARTFTTDRGVIRPMSP